MPPGLAPKLRALALEWTAGAGDDRARVQALVRHLHEDFTYTLGWQSKETGWSILPGTAGSDIMGCFTPEALPVLSTLASSYAVCDQWFASAPTETMPNRAFTCAATSQGHMDDGTHSYTCQSIFGALSH